VNAAFGSVTNFSGVRERFNLVFLFGGDSVVTVVVVVVLLAVGAVVVGVAIGGTVEQASLTSHKPFIFSSSAVLRRPCKETRQTRYINFQVETTLCLTQNIIKIS